MSINSWKNVGTAAFLVHVVLAILAMLVLVLAVSNLLAVVLVGAIVVAVAISLLCYVKAGPQEALIFVVADLAVSVLWFVGTVTTWVLGK